MKSCSIALLFLLCIFSLSFAHPTVLRTERRHHTYLPAHTTDESILFLSDGSAHTFSEIKPVQSTNGKKFHDPLKRVEYDPLNGLPHFVGAAKVGQQLKWSGDCFKSMTGSVEILKDGGFNLHINAANPKSLTCVDWVMFSTSSRFFVHAFVLKGDHTIKIDKWKSEGEQPDVLQNGVRVYEVFNASLITTLMDLYEFYEDFVADPNSKTEQELLQAHVDYFNYTFRPRTAGKLAIPDSAVQSGDVFVLHHMQSGELMCWYLTGGHVGHSAIAVRHDGQLYVCEITDGWQSGYIQTPFQDWLQRYNDHGYEIAWLHLRPDLAAKFDSEKAYSFFAPLRGKPWYSPSYAYIALDTPRDNVSPPLTPEAALLLAPLVEGLNPAEMQMYAYDGLNKRFQLYYHLDAQCTTAECLLDLAALVNVSIFDVMAIPEQDGWDYPKGKSIVCAGLVTNMLRAGGAFGDIQFNAGEISPRDLESFKIYDDVWADRPAACSKETRYCQVAGKWMLDLPDFNSVEPFPHMFEHCGALAPDYQLFPKGC